MRLPAPDPDDLTDEQARYRDAVIAGRPGTPSDMWRTGPFGVWQHAPAIGMAALPVGTEVRAASISPQVREIAILAAGAHFKAKFEFAAHRGIGVAAGLDGDQLDAWAAGEVPAFEGENEVAYRVATTLIEEHRLSDELYAEGQATFGDQGMIELVASLGYYCMVSLTLNAFDVQLAPGMTDPWPDA